MWKILQFILINGGVWALVCFAFGAHPSPTDSHNGGQLSEQWEVFIFILRNICIVLYSLSAFLTLFLVCFLFFLVTPRSFCCACLADCHFNFIWMKRLALPQTLTFIFIDFIIDLESELTVSKNKSGSNSKTHNFTGHFILHNLIKKERKGWFT